MYITLLMANNSLSVQRRQNEDVDRAVEAATEAFKTWKKVSQVERPIIY